MEESRLTPRQKEILWAQQLVAKASAARFFGRIIIEMKEGKIFLVTEEKTFKPPTEEK
jgi:hypothetical protein